MLDRYTQPEDGSIWWAPTKYSPKRQLAPAGSPPTMRQAVIEMHRATIETGEWVAKYWPPCVVQFVPSKGKTPWQVRFIHPNGKRTAASYHAEQQQALEARPDIIREWNHAVHALR